jgi:hypothetical protein
LVCLRRFVLFRPTMLWLYHVWLHWVLHNVVVNSIVMLIYLYYSLSIALTYVTPTSTYIPKAKRYKTPHVVNTFRRWTVKIIQCIGIFLVQQVYSLKSGSTNLPVSNTNGNKVHQIDSAVSPNDRDVGPIQKCTKQHIASSF